ncbi:MAG: N-acetyl sugar amidotransferase [Candidatus Omnitrophica bacterium]|nr:N-acetyl sugar amidotransferase [Candidatus Omnitrophota bacterium]
MKPGLQGSHKQQPQQRVNQSAREVKFCKKCLTPSSRPRITFDAQGVCNACLNSEEKQKIDWQKRKTEFLKLIEPYRSKDGSWDCIVPWSGGKDSSSIAYKLKFEFGLNPLLVTFSPMIPNKVGNHNREEMIRLGFDHLFFRPDQKIQRHLARRFFIERGNPKVCWEAGKEAVPLQSAVRFGIPLVFYAEHGESEYGGKVISEESKRTKDFTEVVEHLVGDDARNWLDQEVTEKDLNPYIYPETKKITQLGVKAFYFAYFFKWSMFENYNFIKDKFDFQTNSKGRTDGTFTNFDSLDDKIDDVYYYMQFIKFGFGRTVRDTSRFIQNDHMNRQEGLVLAQKYDDEFPNEFFQDVLDYLQLSEKEFVEIVDKHRNPEIWKQENGKWKLRYPLK